MDAKKDSMVICVLVQCVCWLGVDLGQLVPGQKLAVPQYFSIADGEDYQDRQSTNSQASSSSSSSSSSTITTSSRGGLSAAKAARHALASGLAPVDGIVAVKIQVTRFEEHLACLCWVSLVTAPCKDMMFVNRAGWNRRGRGQSRTSIENGPKQLIMSLS